MNQIRPIIKKILLEKYLKESNNANTLYVNMDVDQKNKEDIIDIKKLLNLNGFDVYIVGGAVRDSVKNYIKLSKNPKDTTIEHPKDFDLVTNALPTQIKNIFKDAPFISNILEIGESFAIEFLVTKNGNKYEIATFRKDEGVGRKPDSVSFQKSPEEDAKRRDLTINALFYDIKKITDSGFLGYVIDFVGGVNDIKNNVVNTVGNAEDRFSDDPLRKMRTIRFASKMGSKIPKNVSDAILSGNTSLVDKLGKMISNERIRDEFYKGVKSSKSVVNFLELMEKFDFMKHVFGNLKVNSNYFIDERNPMVLLSNILKDNNVDDIRKILHSKNYSSDEINSIVFLVSLINLNDNNVSVTKGTYLSKIKNAKNKINDKIYPITDSVIYKFAELNNIDKHKIKNLLRLAREFVSPSSILQRLGFQGKDFGNAVRKLEKEFYKNPDKIKKIINSKNEDEIKNVLF